MCNCIKSGSYRNQKALFLCGNESFRNVKLCNCTESVPFLVRRLLFLRRNSHKMPDTRIFLSVRKLFLIERRRSLVVRIDVSIAESATLGVRNKYHNGKSAILIVRNKYHIVRFVSLVVRNKLCIVKFISLVVRNELCNGESPPPPSTNAFVWHLLSYKKVFSLACMAPDRTQKRAACYTVKPVN